MMFIREMLGRIHLREIAVVLALMFFGIAGSIPGVAPNQANEMTGAAATGMQVAVGLGSQALVNGVLLLLLFRQRKLLLQQRAVWAWPCVLALWAVVSIAWSQDPLLTVRHALPFAIAAGFGCYLPMRFSQQRLLLLIQVTFVLLACWSAVLAIGFPAAGLDASTGHTGDWQGVFTQKNACGRAMVFALAAVLASGRVTLARCAMLVLFTAELVLSGSRGAWVLGALIAAAIVLFRVSCRFDRASRTALLGVFASAAVCAIAIVTLEFSILAPLLGRDATLTGRTAIWHEVWLSILRHPALGYGFSAFWRGMQGASWDVIVALHFVLFHAHNGFLEIWLELGAAGLLLFVAGFARGLLLLLPELRAGRFGEAAWPMAVLLLIALYDFDENTLLSFNGLYWVLYTATLARLELLAIERRRLRATLNRTPLMTRSRAVVEEHSSVDPIQPIHPWWALPPANAIGKTAAGVSGSPWL